MRRDFVPFKHPWDEALVGEVADVVVGGTPSTAVPAFWNGAVRWMASGDVHQRQIYDVPGRISGLGLRHSNAVVVEPQAVAIALAGQGKTRGTVALTHVAICTNQSIALLKAMDERLNPGFLYQSLIPRYEEMRSRSAGGGRAGLTKGILERLPVQLPRPAEQRRIAEILSAVDEAIEQTEALIAKYQKIKAGLIHDLFTRGVTPDGHLRPTYKQAPHLYKESPLGWIPKEWRVVTIGNLAESVVDGPFGSNLKTEHYVAEPGVRVVRLQNVQDGQYNDVDRAFIAQSHASYLAKNQVNSGDVLIAGLGEDNNVVGRACCYPEGLPPAINKADCFRLRCISSLALNRFVMYFLSTATARYQVRRFEQGVTRRRINTGNLKRVCVVLPSKDEQTRIVSMLDNAVRKTETTTEYQAKLRQQKHGLMADLLTGRVRVKVGVN